ncbi:MAG: FAD-dependent oxidoreductase [Geminicoccaceae bacterium]
MTEQARVVVIGGGAVGCSALYHLARLGWTDCLLIERDELTSGSTWHAAGNCPTFSGSWGIMKLQKYSTELYGRLGAEVDYPINYHVTGSIRLAHTAERMDEFEHVVSMARANGLGFQMLGPDEARGRYPFMETHDLRGALWDPHDGDIDPSQLTQALAKGARDMGCRVRRFERVTGIEQASDGWIVTTDKARIRCETVVNAAGYRAGEVMALLGRHLPTVAMSHQYLVTKSIPELEQRKEKLPLLRDPDVSYYLRQERSGLILGPYEWQATPMWLDAIPDDFAHKLWDDDLGRLERYIEDACARVPILGKVGVQRVINGPIPYSPDGNPYLGPEHGLRGFYHANTFSFGIAQAGGAGKALAEWVVHGEPEWDLWSLDARRYTGYATKSYTAARAVEIYQNEYAPGFPYEERPAGRPLRTSPLYWRLKEKGAVFGARGGWERQVYFDPAGIAPTPSLSFRRERNWNPLVAAEVKAVREAAGIMDLPGFTKFMVEGPGAAAFLDRLLCTRLPRVGRLSLAYALNDKGRILSEFTVSRLADDRFYLCAAASAEWHDEDVLTGSLPADGSVRLDVLSGRLGTLVLTGPKARTILAAVTDTDLSTTAFPWLGVREISTTVGRILALRVSYVGELGWELHAPAESLVALYEQLTAAGAAHGLKDFGLYAMESLRLDKCYRSWKVDLEIGYSPLMASLDRFVDLGKPDFVGKAALQGEFQAGPVERFVPLLLDEPGDADVPACSPVFVGGERVGLVTSGGWSWTLERSVALAYLRTDLAVPGTRVEVDLLGSRVVATVDREPLYDPDNARLRA